MNTLYSRDKDLDDDEPRGRDREMTLGTSFIVGIFFVLVLICAIFFAFGYSLGRRSALPATGITATVQGAGTSKPASGIPEDQTDQQDQSASTSVANSSRDQSPADAKPAPALAPAKPAIRLAAAGRAAASSAAIPGATPSIVQVAAVSRQGDADMLMTALKRKGYNAAIHQTPTDKLLHVQIGPFAAKKDAEAMRQRLIADGYNAIVK